MTTIAPTPQNLLTENAAGALEARLYTAAGNSISVLGTGTSGDPLRISFEGKMQEATQLRSGDSWVSVAGSGTGADPFIVKHATPGAFGTYDGFTIDNAGHVIAYNPPSTVAVRGVTGSDGVKVEQNPATGIVTVSLAPSAVSDVTGTFQIGGYSCTCNKNRIDRLERNVTIAPGEYRMGDMVVTLNEYGSITALVLSPVEPEPEPEPEATPDPLPTAFSRVYSTAGETMREMRFATDKRAAFRISYQSDALPSDTQLFLDGVEITKYAIGTLRYEACTPTDYAPGEHIVSFITRSEEGFLGVGILDVRLVAIGG